MTRRFALPSLLGLAASLISCGSDTESGPTVDELPLKVATATCKSFSTCLGSLITDMLLNGTTCEALFQASLEQGALPLWKESIAAGTVTYHPGKAQACVDAIENKGCAFIQDHVYIPECEAAIQGHVAEGKDCGNDADCAGDLFCKVAATCPGKCSARVASGGACDKDDNCQAGLVCFNDLCTQPLQAGNVCNDDSVDCKAPLVCIKADGAPTGICGAIQESSQLGQTCDFAKMQLCAAGSFCGLDNIDIAKGKATSACLGPVASGGACKFAIPSQCPSGQYCADIKFKAPASMEGTCQALPGAGQPCAKGAVFPPLCAPTLVCVGDTCVARASLDAACQFDEGCASGRCSTGKCVPNDPCLPNKPESK